MTTVFLLHDFLKYEEQFPFITATEMHTGTQLELFRLYYNVSGFVLPI